MKRGDIVPVFTDNEAISHLKMLGLTEITSERHIRNGTRCFLDTRLSDDKGNAVMYTFHRNGRYRRVFRFQYNTWNRWTSDLINRRKKVQNKRQYIHVFSFSAQVGYAISSIMSFRKTHSWYHVNPV